jgi:hypothetical protein
MHSRRYLRFTWFWRWPDCGRGGKKMNVGLIQIDGKLPNLALMKLSAWHKSKGDTVTLLKPDDVLIGQPLFDRPDKLYAAAVFDWSRPIAEKLNRVGAQVGGTGWGLHITLPSEIEAIKPDYDLYGIDYGMGFLSRGCIFQCGPCVVWRKEGKIRHAAWPNELVNPKSKNLVLMDGCFNASPFWREKAAQIIDRGYRVDFTKGLSIRLVDQEQAEIITAMKHRKRIHFAFDQIEYEQEVRRGIELLLRQGIHPDKLSFYVLVNYNSTIEQDLQRIEILDEYGANAFVMVYNKAAAPQKIKHLARWCNKYQTKKSCRFEDYNPSGKAV